VRNPSPYPTDPSELIAEIADELAVTRLDTQALMTALTRTLSRRRPGTWVATLMNRDPSTTRVIVADDSNTPMADYINRYVVAMGVAGGTPNIGLGRQVIDSGQPVLFPRLSLEKLFTHVRPTTQTYLVEHPMPMSAEYVGLIVVPMHAREATIGTLAVIDWNARQQLNETDVKWIQSVADRAGLPLDLSLIHI